MQKYAIVVQARTEKEVPFITRQRVPLTSPTAQYLKYFKTEMAGCVMNSIL